MPLLSIQIMQGHAADQKQALLVRASQAVVDSIGAPLTSVRATLAEFAPADVIVAGQVGHPMARVDVDLIAGRTDEQKAALIRALDQAVQGALGISGADIRVVLCDVPKSDMGLANGVSALAAGR